MNDPWYGDDLTNAFMVGLHVHNFCSDGFEHANDMRSRSENTIEVSSDYRRHQQEDSLGWWSTTMSEVVEPDMLVKVLRMR